MTPLDPRQCSSDISCSGGESVLSLYTKGASPPEATITGPRGLILRYHASYTDGIGIVERGSLAFTRKGIARKARRVLRRLRRDRELHDQASVLR